MRNIHRRQFIIMKARYNSEDFKTTDLSNGYYLSYHKQLNVQKNGSRFLFGEAFHIKHHKGIVLDENVVQDMKNWSGRWILFDESNIYMDAGGTFGVFYGYDAHGDVVCSSSLALLSEVIPNSYWCSNYEIDRGDPYFFDYYPGPYTPRNGIKALLPSQYISLSLGKIVNREDFDFSRYLGYDRNNLESMIIEQFEVLLKNIYAKFGDNIWLPLTGGVDSRTIFALLQHSEIPFSTYTIKRPDTMEYDYRIPRTICKKTGVLHYLYDIEKKRNKSEETVKRSEILEHCGGRTTGGTEIGQYISSLDIPNGTNSIVLWGTVWEFGGGYYSYLDKRKIEVTDSDRIIDCLSMLGGKSWRNSSVHVDSLNSWSSYIYENVVPGIGWTERLYWEQRIGAWLKYSYQMFDMFDSTRVSPINCQVLLEMMYALHRAWFPDGNIKRTITQQSIIDKCCPIISDIPIGLQDSNIVSKFWYHLRIRYNRNRNIINQWND